MSIARRARDAGGGHIQFPRPRGHLCIELGCDESIGTEGVGLDDIRANRKESFVDPPDQVRTRTHQNVRAVLAAEPVLAAAIGAGMDGGPHRPVEEERAPIKFAEKRCHRGSVTGEPPSFNRSSA